MEIKLSKAVEELDVLDAFVWEGSAKITIKEQINDRFYLTIRGYSDVEHQGDISGIENQVEDLKFQSTIIEDTKFTILDASMSWEHDSNSNDSILVKGKVIISYESVSV